MKLGIFTVSYAGFWGQEKVPLEAIIPRAKTFGYDGVMLMAKRPQAFPADMTESRRTELRRLLKDHGLELACVGAYTNFTAGLESKEVPLLDMQAEYVGACAKMARELGGSAVRVFTGYEVPGVPFTQLWSMCVKGLQACCDAAAQHHVNIYVQNHHDIGVHTDALEELILEVDRPNCAPSFDAWSPALRGENIVASARRMGKQTRQTVIADYVRLPRARYCPDLVNYQAGLDDFVRAVPMGEGFIDYKGFINGLRQGGFDGWVIYEMCSPIRGGGGADNMERYARQFVEFMRTFE
jgi:sugar phosphate isomerase/epimerase